MLLSTGRFPQRLVPEGWATVFVAGSAMQHERRAEVLRQFGGAAWQEAAMYRFQSAQSAWGEPTRDDGADIDYDVDAAIWVGRGGEWIARYDASFDVGLIATASRRCVPVLDSVRWLTPGGALDCRGVEATAPDAVVAAMKSAYDATSMPLCDGADLARELRGVAMALASEVDLVPGCRRLRSLLSRTLLLFPPPGAVNEILQLVEDAQFWPEGEERALWADELLSDLDARKDILQRASGDHVRRALRELATSDLRTSW